MAAVVAVTASAAARFDGERPAGFDIDPKHQSDWEPTVAVDPDHANRIYQLITGINAKACQNCPGTASCCCAPPTVGQPSVVRASFVRQPARPSGGSSTLRSGAQYKVADGYTFTDGDYFGLAVSSTGIANVIWGESDGSSLYCCGDVWYTKGPDR